MDVKEVKALIKSLIVSSRKSYTVNQLIHDFKIEAGCPLSKYNFRSVREFLMSLTDIIEITGDPPNDRVILLDNSKIDHIESLVRRQGKYRQFRSMNCESPTESTEMTFSSSPSVTDKICNSDVTCSNSLNGYLFNENEIANIDLQPEEKTCEGNGLEMDNKVSFNTSSVTCGYINESLKEKLRFLMKNQNKGIWCSELPDIFYKYFNSTLEFRDCGYRSLIELVMELKDVFRYVRPDNGDWMLFDASVSPTKEEMDLRLVSDCKVPTDIEKNVLDVISDKENNDGVYLDDFLVLYYRKHKVRLKFMDYGFPNIRSFVKRLDGQILELEAKGNRILMKPIIKETNTPSPPDTQSFNISPEDDIFADLFPSYAVQSGEKYSVLKVEDYFLRGQETAVVAAEVWSPSRFCIQLKAYESDLEVMMVKLQMFYNEEAKKLPISTICVGQVCACLYETVEGLEEWYRGVIRKVHADDVTVNLIDYGTLPRIKMSKLRFLHRDFFELPAQAFAASIYNVKNPSGEKWLKSTSERFLDLISTPNVYFYVIKIDAEKHQLMGNISIEKDGSRTDVGEQLIMEKLALPLIDICDIEVTKDVVKKSGEIVLGKVDSQDNEKIMTNHDLCNLSENEWTDEKEVFALAFNLLRDSGIIRDLVKTDFDTGLTAALEMARTMRKLMYAQKRPE